MITINTIKDIDFQLDKYRKKGAKIGFVPTMGALHEGHISLIKESKKQNSLTVCSIFVNPTQFNDKKDFDRYPNLIENDCKMLEKVGCDILFLPNVKEMYPKGFNNTSKIDFGFLQQTLEGEFRPGHFDGMAQIVEKLLLATMPTNLYMGQKDYQQATICSALIKKRKLKINLILCPIKREKDGLAMSSRNLRLKKDSREKAAAIYKTLKWAKTAFKKLEKKTPLEHITQTELIHSIEIEAMDRLASDKSFQVEYIAIRETENLQEIKTIKPTKKYVILAAAWIGGVRLIDNILI